MKVEKIEIYLTGKFQLPKLEKLGYKQQSLQRYIFDGIYHHYEFIKNDNKSVTVEISKKPGGEFDLDHHITFPQVDDWVKMSVSLISEQDV